MACRSAAMYVLERVSMMETPRVEHSCCSLGLSSVSYRICMCGPWCDVRCSSPAHLTIISVSAFSLLSWCVAYVWFLLQILLFTFSESKRGKGLIFDSNVTWHLRAHLRFIALSFLTLVIICWSDKKTICCLGTEVIFLVYLTLPA